MTSEVDLGKLEPDLLGVVRNSWRLIAIMAFAFALIGFFLGSGREVEWRATASVVVDDPLNATVFGADSSGRPDRYVETQVGIMSSLAVAQRASELLALDPHSLDVGSDEILGGSTVAAQESSDLITVTFATDSAEKAEATANAVISAYLELRRNESVEGFSTALARLDESIAESQDELDALRERIQSQREASPFSTELDARYEEALRRLADLQTSSDLVDSDSITQDLAQINQELDAIEAIARIEGQRPELEALLEEQNLALSRLSTLIARRNEVAVDAELAGGGFVFRSEARPAEQVNTSPRIFALTGAIIGAMLAMGLAYGFATYRRRIDSPTEPELILRTPLLGTIPAFDRAFHTALPVANAPRSRAAEAFRFVMAAVESQLSRSADPGRRVNDRVVFVTSSSPQDGRSTLIANMAVAAARSGRRVLVVDADFETQSITRLLLPDTEVRTGITEIVIGATTIENAVKKVEMIPGTELFLLSRGSDLMGAQDIFGSIEAADLLDALRADYELVLVDSPPLPTVGYATTLARLADRVLIVVRHRTQVSRLEELERRLTLTQSRRIGYVYNQAPSPGEARRQARPLAPSAAATPDQSVQDEEPVDQLSET